MHTNSALSEQDKLVLHWGLREIHVVRRQRARGLRGGGKRVGDLDTLWVSPEDAAGGARTPPFAATHADLL